MANAAKPKSVANMDANFEKQLRKLKKHAAAQAAAAVVAGQSKYLRPEGWNGDPFDYEGMSVPFDRSGANKDLVAAISDHMAPGTTGDVVACSTMINHLSIMERAFRVRHTLRRCRATAHAAGRTAGHGDDRGPFIQLGVEYVRSVLGQAKKS